MKPNLFSPPTRRLPKPSTALSPTNVKGENNLPAIYRRGLKSLSALLPSRTPSSNNISSFVATDSTNEKGNQSASPRSRKNDKSKRVTFQDFTSYSTYKQDGSSRPSYPQQRNSFVEDSQCEVGDCYYEQLPGEAYCRSHICRTKSCGNVRALRSRYCRNHKCPLCSARAEVESSYCEAHKCHVPSCIRGKEQGQDRCKQHVCRWKRCSEDPAPGAWFCQDHICAAGDCGLKVLAIDNRVGNYCCCHTCSAEGCLLRLSSIGAFCVEHECPTRGCPNPRFWDDGVGPMREHKCCKFHTCVQRGCFAPTTQIGTLCYRHFEAAL